MDHATGLIFIFNQVSIYVGEIVLERICLNVFSCDCGITIDRCSIIQGR